MIEKVVIMSIIDRENIIAANGHTHSNPIAAKQ